MAYLGIEIGGTKLQLGVGPGDGTLSGIWRGWVDAAAGSKGIRHQLSAAVPELLGKAGIERSHLLGVGIGFGGPVDDGTQTIIKSHQIVGWDNFPLSAWITDLLGLPAVVGNDADVAGMAEAHFGAGMGVSPVFYITIGSGIGGGLILDGEIYRGCGQGAAEIGHLRVPVEGKAGIRYYPLERIASGWAIQEWARHEAARDKGGWEALLRQVDGEVERLTARDVAEAALLGDDLSWAVLYRAWESLAEAICHVIALVCPRRIIIGGGVSLMGERILFAPLRELVAERVFRPFADLYQIVPAALGEDVVVHGALALARRRISHS
jgi:glucokinase